MERFITEMELARACTSPNSNIAMRITKGIMNFIHDKTVFTPISETTINTNRIEGQSQNAWKGNELNLMNNAAVHIAACNLSYIVRKRDFLGEFLTFL